MCRYPAGAPELKDSPMICENGSRSGGAEVGLEGTFLTGNPEKIRWARRMTFRGVGRLQG